VIDEGAEEHAQRQLGHDPAVPARAGGYHLGWRADHAGGAGPGSAPGRHTNIPRAAAHRFNQVAWPAFGVLIITGIWNVIAVRSQITGSYETTLVTKLIVVLISGVTAALHARARSAAGLAVFGALTGVSALAALFLGVLLAD